MPRRSHPLVALAHEPERRLPDAATITKMVRQNGTPRRVGNFPRSEPNNGPTCRRGHLADLCRGQGASAAVAGVRRPARRGTVSARPMDNPLQPILDSGTVTRRPRERILSPSCGWPKAQGGDSQLPNPLAIGVTLGGLLLDVVAPRPKPRSGSHMELSPLSERTGSRTHPRPMIDKYDGTPVASGLHR